MRSTAEPRAAADPGSADPARRFADAWVLFALAWAVAVLFHLAGNSLLAPTWGKALLGASAVAVLARPRSTVTVAAMAGAVLVNVWLEAPLLSNHWFLHGFVAVVVLGGLATRPTGEGAAMARVHGPLRLVLLAFYCFAAFAKLNVDFFEPSVSCGLLFLEESAASWGFVHLVEGWWSGAHRGLAIAVATIELAVPILLAVTRTRQGGVVLALAFHFVLAVNRDHQFFDFSSVLVALFLLFLTPETASTIRTLLVRARDRLAGSWASGPELLRLGALAGAALVTLLAAGSERWGTADGLHDVGVWLWLAYGAASIGVVTLAVRRTPAPPNPLVTGGAPGWLFAVPVLALLNGVAPYVEAKTAASWNMYSNLRVVEGDSNHLLVRRGVPLTDVHERLVEIVASEGVDLSFYIGTDWRLPEQMLIDDIADDPGARVLGRVDGRLVTYEGGQGGARPIWQRKLQVFRAVDGEGRAGCQATFGPAR